MTQAQVDVAIQEARLNAEVWSVLTPEQQAQAAKLRAERKARLEERRQEIQQRRQNYASAVETRSSGFRLCDRMRARAGLVHSKGVGFWFHARRDTIR